MKKSYLYSFLFTLVILSGIFLSASIPKINVQIVIGTDNSSVAHAQDTDNSSREAPGCLIYRDYDLGSLSDAINENYISGYRLEKFFVANDSQGLQLHFAAMCKN